ncbi:MAG TPA: DUF58 domain-containing protein [Pyrinomonadaceae bacterium]|nr:DUF58 domain-containing protein [Pyrinomonadaceae bacterium]
MSVWRQLSERRASVVRLLIVLGGVGAAAVTVAARRAEVWDVARAGAVASLLFALLMLVFVVPPLARSAEFPVQLTSGGLIFFGIFAVVAFSAWNTGNNLLFLVFSVLASSLFVAWSAARASLRDLVVSARFPDHIFAGESAPVAVTLHNRKRLLPSFSVLVEARVGAGDDAKEARRARGRARRRNLALAYFMYAPRGVRVEQRVEQLFAERGRTHITGFEISTRFPFGFFRLRKRLRTRDLDLVVYPRPGPSGDILHLLPTNAGRVASARRGAGHDLHSLRDYQAQDDMRHIDWKATARASRLTVREFTAEDERRIHVVFDTRLNLDEEARDPGDEEGLKEKKTDGAPASSDGVARSRFRTRKSQADARRREMEEKFAARFERGVTVAASLVKHFIDERAEVRLTLGGEAGRYGEGPEQLYASLHRLALVGPSPPSADESHADSWLPTTFDARDTYVILITTAPRGSIPAHVWRKSHVIHV